MPQRAVTSSRSPSLRTRTVGRHLARKDGGEQGKVARAIVPDVEEIPNGRLALGKAVVVAHEAVTMPAIEPRRKAVSGHSTLRGI
jgi:hypothetical protein